MAEWVLLGWIAHNRPAVSSVSASQNARFTLSGAPEAGTESAGMPFDGSAGLVEVPQADETIAGVLSMSMPHFDCFCVRTRVRSMRFSTTKTTS